MNTSKALETLAPATTNLVRVYYDLVENGQLTEARRIWSVIEQLAKAEGLLCDTDASVIIFRKQANARR
jgi:hypothetical protein